MRKALVYTGWVVLLRRVNAGTQVCVKHTVVRLISLHSTAVK